MWGRFDLRFGGRVGREALEIQVSPVVFPIHRMCKKGYGGFVFAGAHEVMLISDMDREGESDGKPC